MKKILMFPLLASACLLTFTACEKTTDLPEIQIESALEYAQKYAATLNAERRADHISTYITNCTDADFVNTLQETNDYMMAVGFNHFEESEVFASRNENILFYPLLRGNEQNSGFLNLCMPFFRENESEQPILLLEGPGAVGISLVADVLISKGEDVEDNAVPLTVDSPGSGSFDMGYATSFFTKNGRVEIDFDVENPYNDDKGTLNVCVTSSEAAANFEKSWLIRF